MAIHSTYLGSTTFTGDDAKKFMHLMRYGRKSAAVTEAVENGRKLAREFNKHGYATIKLGTIKALA